MKTKLWLLLLLLCGVSKANGAAIQVIDGRIAFVGYCASCTLTAPQDFEVNLATTLVVVIDGRLEFGFENYSDWQNCQTKTGLRRKYRQIQSIIDSFGILPASLTQELRERAGWLRSYYLSLP